MLIVVTRSGYVAGTVCDAWRRAVAETLCVPEDRLARVSPREGDVTVHHVGREPSSPYETAGIGPAVVGYQVRR